MDIIGSSNIDYTETLNFGIPTLRFLVMTV